MPEPFSRYVSELYLDDAAPYLEDGEWHVWRALMTCDDTTLFGFFRPRLLSLASNARQDIKTTSAMLVKLDEAKVLTFDRSWLWLPGYFELQKATRVPNWMKAVRNGAAAFKGDPANRAFRSFCDRFADVLSPDMSKPPPPEEGEDDQQQGDRIAQPPPKKKQRPSRQTILAPPFSEFLEFVKSVRTAGDRKHPQPMAKAESIYDWIDKSDVGWTDDWQRLTRRFVIQDIGEDVADAHDEPDLDAAGSDLGNGVRLAI